MKSILLILTLSFCTAALSQPVVYPLQVGTKWNFKGFGPITPSAPMKVTRDTVMANGKKYSAVLYNDTRTIDYQRIQNDTVFIYDTTNHRETLLYRFNADEKDTIATFSSGNSFYDIILIDTAIADVFGKKLRVFTFRSSIRHAIDAATITTIADSIGVIQVIKGAGYETDIQGAFVNGIKYGTIDAFTQAYYPLAIGNQWFYDSTASLKTVKVIGDSLFSNNFHYIVLSTRDFAGGRYVRADSHYVYYYDEANHKDVPFFNLGGKKGDIMSFTPSCNGTSRTIILSIDTLTFFGQKTRVISYQLDELTKREISLSDKFGLVSVGLYSDPPPPWPDFTYTAAGCIIDGWKYGLVTSVLHERTAPDEFVLSQNYPNPFNPSTTIAYQVSARAHVVITIFNAIGQCVATLVDEVKAPGAYSVVWNASRQASGTYFYRMRAGAFTKTQRMAIVK